MDLQKKPDSLLNNKFYKPFPPSSVMTLSPEEVEELKEQLRQQIQHLPDQQRTAAEAQIAALSSEALESMLQQQRPNAPASGQKTIFRMIVDKDVQSYQIEDNADALAVLDINPITKGHTIIIPKKPVTDVKEIPEGAHQLASHLSKTLVRAVDAKKVEIITDKKFGEAYIHLIPVFDTPVTLSSPRSSADQKDLSQLSESIKLMKKPEPEKIKLTKAETNQVLRLGRKI